MNNTIKMIRKNLVNIPGWRTDRKIIVIESDDWGSIRMPSKEVYNLMVEKKLINENYTFAKYDALASEIDLAFLFEVLSSFKDSKNNHPVFTANCIVANPDFEKIRKHNFEEYFFEPFTLTLSKYPKHEKCFDIWKQGMSNGVFFPQFHGREHINVKRWMRHLSNDHIQFKEAFDLNTFFINPGLIREKNINIAPALDFDSFKELENLNNILSEGYYMFNSIFGYSSKTFIAPNYTWHPETEKKLFELGILYIQSSKIQNIPIPGKNGYSKRFIYTGKHNRLGQTYFARNCYFEPSLNNSANLINSCLNSISNAFFWGKPAIISSHRLNYVGYIDEKNRDKNLILLRLFISKILDRWPDVEFITSAQLGDIITENE